MIKIYPATVNTASPALYAVEIDESVRSGFGASTTPGAVVTVVSSGSPVTAGDATMQSLTFSITLTYQPCGSSSETRVRTYAETIMVAVPGSMGTITPTIGTVTASATKTGCCGKAYGVQLLTSVSVAYSA